MGQILVLLYHFSYFVDPLSFSFLIQCRLKRWFCLLFSLFLFRHFRGDEGLKNNVILEAFLSSWLSRHVLPSRPKDGINAYMLPLAVRLARGKKLPLRTLYLGSLLVWTSVFGISLPWWDTMMWLLMWTASFSRSSSRNASEAWPSSP